MEHNKNFEKMDDLILRKSRKKVDIVIGSFFIPLEICGKSSFDRLGDIIAFINLSNNTCISGVTKKSSSTTIASFLLQSSCVRLVIQSTLISLLDLRPCFGFVILSIVNLVDTSTLSSSSIMITMFIGDEGLRLPSQCSSWCFLSSKHCLRVYCWLHGYFVARSAYGTERPRLITCYNKHALGAISFAISTAKKYNNSSTYKVDRIVNAIFLLPLRSEAWVYVQIWIGWLWWFFQSCRLWEQRFHHT